MWQNLIVGLIVLVAALYTAWRLMPGGLRQRMAAGAAASSQRAGLLNAEQAEQLQHKLGTTSGCGGGCDGCGKGCGAPGKEEF